ncbi:glycine-rich RNA-binding, abscisic acid-inducible protein-like [Vigna umbellata]|uniref:glycine-rich RNA-binding, abscisic acid-inducible protein-like n=1 Tax=Vigna umbellata TaxID=87088 RepID=UPI001F5E5289|nr:glycine-rich RNA-binding, abscisic acid-inducible protein-like [Vigna umbellata]
MGGKDGGDSGGKVADGGKGGGGGKDSGGGNSSVDGGSVGNMKAPGGDGSHISREAFESNPKAYFSDLHAASKPNK